MKKDDCMEPEIQTRIRPSYLRPVFAFYILLLFCTLCARLEGAPQVRPPNIILIITDDQGWSQVGVHGNDVLRTPNLDRFASDSVEFTRFYVSPVCAPTRASLMTGRYNYRTGVVDTYLGRAMMDTEETTLAELLSKHGFQTGIFGKWHLGDNYPMRPIDQGFHRAVVHKGGGIGPIQDHPDNSYFNPVLQVNGKPKRFEGYCTDIFFNRALEYIEENRDRPFFIYLPTNAPHSPYDVPDQYIQPYRKLGLSDRDARIYGMIANIDENVGRLMDKLQAWALVENTIVIFMTDNGPTTQHYTAGLREMKTSVYEGGIRAPFFFRWPARLRPHKVDRPAAHIDIVPTLLEAAGVPKPQGVLLDGRSLMPLLLDGKAAWGERVLYIQSHRGDEPQLYRNFAAIGPRYKLVQPLSFSGQMPPNPKFELYDITSDPGEKRNLAEEHPDIVQRLKTGYEQWFREVSASRGYHPPRIHIGTEHESPVILTRQNWRVVGKDGWADSDLGYWQIFVAADGRYDILLRFGPFDQAGTAEIQVQGRRATQNFEKGATEVRFDSTALRRGEATLHVDLKVAGSDDAVGARYVEVHRLDE